MNSTSTAKYSREDFVRDFKHALSSSTHNGPAQLAHYFAANYPPTQATPNCERFVAAFFHPIQHFRRFKEIGAVKVGGRYSVAEPLLTALWRQFGSLPEGMGFGCHDPAVTLKLAREGLSHE